ncbi:PHD finger family protein, putative isoform 2 [Hibiscus syriacus]|uniref:PHD finger family protein, putative isoform 2 n=1 Tax=Hibiscus syriacus TaxID=106335 RepID=A0A6A2XT19_HIBSY|nr:PHD finger family protein, putative isoform 2 [Hibiscus syriacus]
MTGALYHRQKKKMMGRGADRGCGTEEKPCRPISRVSSRSPLTQPETSGKQYDIGVDFFSQARKALSQRSPFDIPEGGSVAVLSVPTLPSGLVSLLKQTDSRKRHKKSHSGADKKSSKQGKKAREASIWVETEEYFRDLTLPDIDALSDITPFRSLAARKKCFMIPYVGNEPAANLNLDTEVDDKVSVISGENFNIRNEHGNICEGKEVFRVEDGQLMEIDSRATQAQFSLKEPELCFAPDSTSSLELLLGSRSRVLLTSERPSKKRKLVGEDAGLEKILIACPCDVNSSLCNFCCTGDTGKESNRLIVCSSCKVSVHQKCYGVQNNVDSSWLCSWCKQGNDGSGTVKPCVLCPKQGGALKPIQKNDGNDASVEFAHLFCSQWMPEVYIEDLKKMEPIINVGGINDTRKKLVCNVCKVKFGACVRCSHGTCRTSFHPICAREARHRMEVWGRYGFYCHKCSVFFLQIELRVFCSKHSEIHDNSNSPPLGNLFASGTHSSITNPLHLQSMDKSQNSKVSLSNGDKIAVDIEAPGTRSSSQAASECGETQQLGDVGLLGKSNDDEHNPCNSLNFAMILKKLIDRGKVNVKDVALEIGLSADSLSASLNNDSLSPDLRCKIVKWLSNHAYIVSSQKNLKVNMKSLISSKDEIEATYISDDIMVSKSDIADLAAVKPMPPRRTKNNVKNLRDNKVICSDEIIDDIGVVMDEVSCDLLAKEETNDSSKVSILGTTGKVILQIRISTDLLNDSLYGRSQSERATTPEKKQDQGNAICPMINPVIADLIRTEEFSNFYIHPYTRKQMLEMHHGMLCKNRVGELNGKKDTLKEFDGNKRDLSCLVASSNASVCCSHQIDHSKCNEKSCQSDDLVLSVKAGKLGAIKFSPEDEVEGEIIYYQHRLLGSAVARNHATDNLVSRVAKSLPQEVETARTKIWDIVLVNQYLYELREAKKQGRKERRHKEAQAVLAADTAAVAASSRISSSRKDGLEDSSHQENVLKPNASVGRSGINSQTSAKDALSRNAVPRISSEKYSDSAQSVTDFSKGHPRSCDICRRSETMLNPILVCSGCKVAVHLDCYRNVKESTGRWRCELCEELFSFRPSGAPSLNFWEKPYPAVECGLCGGTTGAFRKSVDGQWVHAFCAEWVLESTFRRGQVNPVEGMEMASRGVDVCCICGCKHGACIKCRYGHCQITFHPSCARSAGFCMNVNLGGGKLHHKAYCEQHSVEQRAKAETQKHGIEELKNMKQIRVELERLRLLCERIIKREKLKRELVLCSHEILACKREHASRSVLIHSPFSHPDVSSESATTSLKGHTDDNKSCSEAMRSDDVTVDSTLSVKRLVKVVPVPMDNNRRTDDSSTSLSLFVRKPTERVPFSGRQIPHRYSLASRNALVNAEWNSKSRKPIETFEKELVMTSDEASMKNSRLPKGYCYVPVDCLPKEKQLPQDACSDGQLEHNG